MGRVISIANQKGGVGKTTTAINLSACLSEIGQKVLTIDIDPQGNTTSGLGVDKHAVENNVYALLLGENTIEECIIETEIENQSLISSDVNLAGAEIELIGIDEKEYILKKAISKIKDNYDFIIIDCPPSLNMLTVNALTASDTVLVPIQCEYYALEGLSQLIHTIELVQDRLNPDLDIEITDWLLKNDEFKKIAKFPDDKRIVCKIVHECFLMIERKSERLSYCWSEFTVK